MLPNKLSAPRPEGFVVPNGDWINLPPAGDQDDRHSEPGEPRNEQPKSNETMPQNTPPNRLLSDGTYVNYTDQGRRAVQVLNEDPDHHITGYTNTTDGWHHTIKSDIGRGRTALDDPRL